MNTFDPARADLLERLSEQRDLLTDYCVQFDAGKSAYARPIATALRVLIHQTRKSHALLEQLEIRTRIAWLNTAEGIDPRNLLPTWGLVASRLTVIEGMDVDVSWVPHLDNTFERPKHIQFTGWWKRPVAKDSSGRFWSREDLVLAVANKDGGAHVDQELPEDYSALTRGNSFGATAHLGSAVTKPAPDPVPACVRQIAYETVESLERWP